MCLFFLQCSIFRWTSSGFFRVSAFSPPETLTAEGKLDKVLIASDPQGKESEIFLVPPPSALGLYRKGKKPEDSRLA